MFGPLTARAQELSGLGEVGRCCPDSLDTTEDSTVRPQPPLLLDVLLFHPLLELLLTGAVPHPDDELPVG